jgi:puromycin-sensitive aminopeptidase
MSAPDPYRLPATVRPSRYDLVLEPDLEAAAFAGSATIALRVEVPTNTVVLNAIELDIDAASLSTPDSTIEVTAIELDEETERATLTFAEEIPAGTAILDLAFRGILNDKLRGFYRSTYTNDVGEERTLATTQFESTNARRAFPCFDEPEFKAVFGVTLVVASDLMAVSCGDVIDDESTGDGRKRITFADTMLMSTYLVAFIVGELEVTEAKIVNGTPIRIVHVPGKGHLTQFGMDVGVFALTFLETFYGIDYPGDKIDMVAVPDFAFGAMENLGCVTFRETLLLADLETATAAELTRMADVISHELAHMWFGDLVTMSWWEGIWLKEAFATFMEVHTVDAYKPEWKRWEQFSRERAAAFETDSLASTRPIEFPVVSPADAEAMYDVLTYEKGAAIVRMLEQYLGEENFRAGVQHYLTKHSYGNTRTTDLWDALEESTGSPVRSTMDTWIYQGGHPIIEVSSTGSAVTLRQRQFRYDGTGDTTWAVPIVMRVSSHGTVTEHRVLLSGTETSVDVAGEVDWLVANSGSNGFFRVEYSAALRSALVEQSQEILSGPERISLVDDLVASVVAGSTPAIEIVTMAEGFTFEEDLGVWRALVAGLAVVNRLVDGSARSAFQDRVGSLLRGAFDIIGAEPADDEDSLTRELRALLLRTLGTMAKDGPAQAQCRVLLRTYLDDPASVEPNLAAAAVAVVADVGTDEDFAAYLDKFRNAATPQEEQRFLFALAGFPGEDHVDTLLEMSTSEIRSQNAPFVIALSMRHHEHGPKVWEFVAQNWDELNNRFPDNSISRMLSGITSLTDEPLAAAVAAFVSEHPVPQGAKTVEQHVERMHINVALKQREADRLAADL